MGAVADTLTISPQLGLRVVAAGLFISSGHGTHPDRVLNDHELIVVRKGSLRIEEAGVRFEVPAEHAFLLHSGRRHAGTEPFGRDLSFYWIHFVLSDRPRRFGDLHVPKLQRVARFECVAALFHRYLEDQEAGLLEPTQAGAILLQILSEVSRAPLGREPTRSKVLVGRVEAYVTRNLGNKLSTSRIARALRTNADYLNRVFRQATGTTVTEYIRHRRLRDAAGMLREEIATIAEVAYACGYTSVGHFRRLFQRYHGVTPSAYRKLGARAFVNAR